MPAMRSALLVTTALCLTAAPPALSQINQDMALDSLNWVLRDWDVTVNATQVGELTGDITFEGIRATRGPDALQIDRLEIDGAVYDGDWMVGWDGIRIDKLRAAGPGSQVAIEAIALTSPALDWSLPLEMVRTGQEPDPQLAIDYFYGLDIPGLTVEGISVVTPDDDTAVNIDRVSLQGLSDGVLGAFELSGLAVADPDANVTIDRVAFSNFALMAMLEFFAPLSDDSPFAMRALTTEQVMRALSPLDSFRLDGLDVVPADPESPSVDLETVSYTTGPRINGYPSTASVEAGPIVIPVGEIDDPTVQEVLSQLDVDTLRLTLRSQETYDAALQTYATEISVEAADIWDIAIGVRLSNVVADEIAAAIMAAGRDQDPPPLSLAFDGFSLSLEDQVFIPRLIDVIAPLTGQDPLSLVATVQGAMGMLGMAEPSLAPLAIDLSNAVGSLMRSGGTITLNVTADPPMTVTEIEAMSGQEDPQALLQRLDITVDYEGPR